MGRNSLILHRTRVEGIRRDEFFAVFVFTISDIEEFVLDSSVNYLKVYANINGWLYLLIWLYANDMSYKKVYMRGLILYCKKNKIVKYIKKKSVIYANIFLDLTIFKD